MNVSAVLNEPSAPVAPASAAPLPVPEVPAAAPISHLVTPSAAPVPAPAPAAPESSADPAVSSSPTKTTDYQAKLAQLRKRSRDLEQENDQLVTKLSRARRNIDRLRAERSFLFSKLEEMQRKAPAAASKGRPAPPTSDMLASEDEHQGRNGGYSDDDD